MKTLLQLFQTHNGHSLSDLDNENHTYVTRRFSSKNEQKDGVQLIKQPAVVPVNLHKPIAIDFRVDPSSLVDEKRMSYVDFDSVQAQGNDVTVRVLLHLFGNTSLQVRVWLIVQQMYDQLRTEEHIVVNQTVCVDNLIPSNVSLVSVKPGVFRLTYKYLHTPNYPKDQRKYYAEVYHKVRVSLEDTTGLRVPIFNSPVEYIIDERGFTENDSSSTSVKNLTSYKGVFNTEMPLVVAQEGLRLYSDQIFTNPDGTFSVMYIPNGKLRLSISSDSISNNYITINGKDDRHPFFTSGDKQYFCINQNSLKAEAIKGVVDLEVWEKDERSTRLFSDKKLLSIHLRLQDTTGDPNWSSSDVDFYLNEKEYLSVLLREIQQAKRNIYISSRSLAPNILLDEKRSIQLQDALLDCAKKGANVFILLFGDIGKPKNSDTTIELLRNLHPNVMVIRHRSLDQVGVVNSAIQSNNRNFPQVFDYGWENNQNFVVIDFEKAFLGNGLANWTTLKHSRPMSSVQVRLSGKSARDLANIFIIGWNTARSDILSKKLTEASKKEVNSLILDSSATNSGFFSDEEKHLVEGYPTLSQEVDSTADINLEIDNPSLLYESLRPNLSNSVLSNVLVSLSRWNAGVPTIHSIYDTYLDLIRNSKYFLYIENQYLFGRTYEDVDPIENNIVLELHNRLDRAIQANEPFRLIITLPTCYKNLHAQSPDHVVLKYQLRVLRDLKIYIEQSLSNYRSTRSLEDYLLILTLRSYEQETTNFVSQGVEVNSNLMIVDDRVVILGSAAINDRSLLGDRNAEVAVVLSDTRAITSKMNKRQYSASKFAGELRRKLWMKHFYLPSQYIYSRKYEDIMDDSVWREIQEIARWNMNIFDQVFNGIPSNLYPLTSAFPTAQSLRITDADQQKKTLSNLQGNIAEFPINFLANSHSPITYGFGFVTSSTASIEQAFI